MKTIGDRAKAFRISKGWNSAQMAKAVGTSRQNIESLESSGDRTPRYVSKLAKTMGITVDELMGGRATAELTLPSFSMQASGGPSNPHQISPEEALAALAAMFSQADPDTLNTVSSLLAGFGRNPASHAKVARALQVILTPEEKYDKDRNAPPYDGHPLRMAG